MARIELLDFQQEAADKLFESAVGYFEKGQDKIGHRSVPFVGQLKAVTGAGKTPILAKVVGCLSPAIILWTTRFGSVVDQTANNLKAVGKYNHLLGAGPVEVIKFGEVASVAEWRRVLERTDGLTILVSTVAAWNSTEQDDRLNVHRINTDWGVKSRWEQLKTERNRPLYVVYDEAHNTTTEQIDQLDDLDPSGFLVASASPIRGKLQQYLTNLPDEQRIARIVSVRTRDVVDAQLLKSTISIADYDSPTEDMIAEVVKRRNILAANLITLGSPTVPKAIYVVEVSNRRGEEAPPAVIWKTLVNTCGVNPSTIAICTNTRDLPTDAIRVQNIDELSDQYVHIIFNKKLQEGWDDPSVYLCYLDGRTESATRIQQVIGRALRQPDAMHLSDEDLNTAYFFVNVPNDLLEEITDRLKEDLRVYKDEDEPDDFEPFQFKEERRAPAKIPVKPDLEGKLRVPNLQLELPTGDYMEKIVRDATLDIGEADLVAPGRALVNIVSMRTGEVQQAQRDLLEDMRVRCGAYLHGQIRQMNKNCAHSMHPGLFQNARLDKFACYKSKALEHYKGVAERIVDEYENHVQLGNLGDPDPNMGCYVVGPYQPSVTVPKEFDNAGHLYYDTAAFNGDELAMAKALDRSGYVWVRNKDRLDYRIPLPVKSGSSSNFFPDFLWWVNDVVWAIDPTAKFLLDEKIRTKLLDVPPPLRIALVTKGKYSRDFRLESTEGLTLMRRRLGNSAPEKFETLEEVLKTLIAES